MLLRLPIVLKHEILVRIPTGNSKNTKTYPPERLQKYNS